MDQVLTPIDLTNNKGEPAQGALDFKPVDRIKVQYMYGSLLSFYFFIT